MLLKKIYTQIVGQPYTERKINYINDNIGRKDEIYDILAKKYLFDNNKKKLLLKLIKIFQKEKNTTYLSFISYIYALNHKREKAIITMQEVIYMEKGKNIDSWIDLAMFMRKLKKYEKLSTFIIFNLEKIITHYKEETNIIKYCKELNKNQYTA